MSWFRWGRRRYAEGGEIPRTKSKIKYRVVALSPGALLCGDCDWMIEGPDSEHLQMTQELQAHRREHHRT